ncbi:MAG: EAL domain-containing protein, partial [Lachnospiraceae bacterium]|nr:EAL domain-containing protein [Lachnospiraceae bacterium]
MLPVNQFHIALYMAAFLLSVTCLVYTIIQSRTDRPQNKVYLIMLFIVIINSATGTISDLIYPYRNMSQTAYMVFELMYFLYFFFHTALCPALCYYVICVTGEQAKFTKKKSLLYAAGLFITEFLVVLNPLTHWVFYFDENHDFSRNWAETLIYLAAVVYFILAIGKLTFSWDALTKRRRRAILYFYFVVVAGVVIQLFNVDIKSELFGEALALMGVMLAVESEDDRLDADTGFYNRKALQMDLNNYILAKQVFQVLCIKVMNADIIQRVTGSSNTDILSEIVADYFKSLLPRYCIYHTNPSTFMLTCMETDADRAEQLAEDISERFEKSWECNDTEIVLQVVVMRAVVPLDLSTPEDVFYMADSPIPASVNKKILSGLDLGYLIRRASVERAIHRGFEEDAFEVYYQPTYHLQGQKIHGAEALIRLHDEALGFIPPDEFIPIAEQIGMIDQIGDFVLHEVCAFLKSGVPTRSGMDCINVNLSVIQCMQPDFVTHILGIIESYGIDKRMLNFEITESVAAHDYNVLNSVVRELKENGILFSMDDYGTGYSNIQSVFALDFDIIKIDK